LAHKFRRFIIKKIFKFWIKNI